MKSKYLIIWVIVIVIVVLIIVIRSVLMNKKIVTISNIKSFHFSYSTGNMINASVSYDLKCDNDIFIATIKPDGVAIEDAIKIEVTNEQMKKLEDILKKYHVEKWNGFDKVDKNVLDGNSFSLSIRMKDNSYISAYGYMKWPKNYSEVSNELGEFFAKLQKNT